MVRVGRIAAVALAAMTAAGTGRAAAEEAPQPLTERPQTVESVVATPVEDLNLKKKTIPEVLQKASADPYHLNGATSCEAIAAEIARLDAALGADKDATPEPASPGEQRQDMAVGVLRAGVQSMIPFRGMVRQITGANAQDRKVAETIQVGFARRGFLKGRAVEMNCPPGASPANFTPVEIAAAAPAAEPPAPDLEAAAPLTLEAPPAPPEAATSIPAPPD